MLVVSQLIRFYAASLLCFHFGRDGFLWSARTPNTKATPSGKPPTAAIGEIAIGRGRCGCPADTRSGLNSGCRSSCGIGGIVQNVSQKCRFGGCICHRRISLQISLGGFGISGMFSLRASTTASHPTDRSADGGGDTDDACRAFACCLALASCVPNPELGRGAGALK